MTKIINTFFLLDDALEANDLVTAVFQKYHQLVIKNKSNNANLLVSTPHTSNVSHQNGTNRNTMDELNEIFASSSKMNHSNTKPTMTFSTLEPMLASNNMNSNGNFQFYQKMFEYNEISLISRNGKYFR